MPKFQPGQSGNPKGRRRGQPDGAHALRTQLSVALDGKNEELLRKAISMAMAGDSGVMQSLLDRLIPKLRPEAIAKPLPIDPVAPYETNSAAILGALSRGELSIENGLAVIDALQKQSMRAGSGAVLSIHIHTGDEAAPLQTAQSVVDMISLNMEELP